MNVLLAVHGYPPTHHAGAERAAERIATWLVSQGHSVHVFACERLDASHTHVVETRDGGVVVHRLHYHPSSEGNHFRGLYDSAHVEAEFTKLLDAHHFDVVHIVSGYLLGARVIRAAKAAGLPVVLTLTEFWFMCHRLNLLTPTDRLCPGPVSDEACVRCDKEVTRRYRVPSQVFPLLTDAVWRLAAKTSVLDAAVGEVANRRNTLRAALESVDLVICPSRFIMAKFAEHGFDTSRFLHLRHGLKHDEAVPPRGPRPVELPLRLGYLGQIKPHKGVDLIVDALEPLLDRKAAITVDLWGSSAGSEAYGTSLKARTAHRPAIRWQGTYDPARLWEILGELDALLVPSRWYENSPTVILEAQAARLPVIATRLGGMQELVSHERSGLLFGLNDAGDLRRQIQRVSDDRAFLCSLSRNISPIPTIEDEVGSIYSHYVRLIASRRGTGHGTTSIGAWNTSATP